MLTIIFYNKILAAPWQTCGVFFRCASIKALDKCIKHGDLHGLYTWIIQDQTGELLSVCCSRFRRRIGNTALHCFISSSPRSWLARLLMAIRMSSTEEAVGERVETWEQVYYSSMAKHRHAQTNGCRCTRKCHYACSSPSDCSSRP